MAALSFALALGARACKKEGAENILTDYKLLLDSGLWIFGHSNGHITNFAETFIFIS